MIKNKKKEEGDKEKDKDKNESSGENNHLGSSNAFAETEDPLSRDPDNISDERLDELLGD
jgi:hypothetical protein